MIRMDVLRRAIFLLIGSNLIAGCEAFYGVTGRVESCATRKPIANAKVTLRIDQPKRTGYAESEADGSFAVAVNYLPIEEKPSDLSVRKEGFKDYDAHITRPTVPQAICLSPAETPSTSQRSP